MSAHARVIALGQRAAGDDGVGPAVLESLRRRPMPTGTELLHAEDALDLMALLETPTPIVLIDAVLGARPGEVLECTVADLARQPFRSVSSHGISVGAVLELTRLLSPAATAPAIRVVAVTITHADRFCTGLSPSVAAAVGHAADRVIQLVGRDRGWRALEGSSIRLCALKAAGLIEGGQEEP